MSRQLWLPGVLRAAGLTVVEVPGWQTRSADEDSDASTFNPGGVIIHETRGSATSSDAGEIGVLVNGRVGLSGPIAQCYIGRDGRWHVVAAGLCHHVKTGWDGPFAGWGNTRLLGIEPAHSVDEDWADKPAQYRSYVRGVAAIIKHKGWPAPVGHKEHQPGDKPDPEFSMIRFRADVAAVIAGEDDDMQLTDPVHMVNAPDVAYSSSTTTVEGVLAGTHYYVLQTRNRMEAGQRAILAAVQGLDTDAVIAAVNQRADEDARRDAELLDLVRRAETGGATAAEIAALVAANLAARLQS